MSLKLKIVSPEKIQYDGEVSIVTVPGTLGRFQVLQGHQPIISSLEKGVVEYIDKDGMHNIEIVGGFVEVRSASQAHQIRNYPCVCHGGQ